ncbi:MAG: hypothetical protein ACPG4X_16475 [Pikeienuella sp.]
MARVPRINRNSSISQVAEAPPQRGVGFAALADVAAQGAEFFRPAAIEDAKIKGTQAVYRDESGQLQIDERNVLGGELAAAHNSAAYAKYLSQRKIDMRASFTEMAIRYQSDPYQFQQASDAYIRLMEEDESAPALLREDLLATAQQEQATRVNGLRVQETDRTHREAGRETSAHRDLLADDYINLVMQGDAEGAAAVYAEMEGVTAYRANAPFITETPSESEAYMSGVRGAARAAQIVKELDSLDGVSSITDERRAEIQTLIDDPDITPEIRQRLYAATDGKLKGIDGRAIADSLASSGIEAATRNYNEDRPRATHQTTIEYSMGPSRPNAPNAPVMDVIGASVESVLGAGARVVVTSGQEGDLPQHGSNRHKTGDAADIAIYAPDGTRITSIDPRMADIARAAAANGALGIGFGAEYMGGDHIHIDLVEPGEGQGHFWASGAQEIGRQLTGAMRSRRTDFARNRVVLENSGIGITPGSEFFSAITDVGTAVSIYNADPASSVSELLSAEVLEANPVLNNMTVQQARDWAERRGTVKASDIAARRTQIDQIEDPEVRDIALSALNDHYTQRRRLEDAAAVEYQARVEANDSTLTEREIASDNSLSDAAQRTLTAEMQKNRKAEREIQTTLSQLADENFTFDPYNSSQRSDIDDAYRSILGDQSPLSEAGMVAGAEFTVAGGTVPKTMFNALRSAAKGNDPEAMAAAMEFTGQMLQVNPNAFGPLDGKTDVLSAFSDYEFYSGMMGGEAAAARMIENAANPAPKNQRDAAKDAADHLSPDDVIGHIAGAETLGNESQQGAIMSEYKKLFTDEFLRTGDEGLSRNRALDGLARVYGANAVTGGNRVMRYPPQNFYPVVPGQPNWMRDQIALAVSTHEFGDDARGTPSFAQGLVEGMAMSPMDRIPADRIIMSSDDRTHRDVASGKPPTYGVSYLDDDDMLQVIPGRYQFDPPAPQSLDTNPLDRTRNVKVWMQHYQSQGMSMNDANSAITADIERHATTSPPRE